jgi:hypothetical protein
MKQQATRSTGTYCKASRRRDLFADRLYQHFLAITNDHQMSIPNHTVSPYEVRKTGK